MPIAFCAFLNALYISNNRNTMLNRFPFLKLVWTTCVPISESYVRSLFSWMCPSLLRIFKHLDHWHFGHGNVKRESTTWIIQREGTLWCAVSVNGVVATYFIYNEQFKKSIIIKPWTRTFCQKLDSRRGMQFSRKMEFLITLRAPPMLCSTRCSVFHGLEDMVNRNGHQAHWTFAYYTFQIENS